MLFHAALRPVHTFWSACHAHMHAETLRNGALFADSQNTDLSSCLNLPCPSSLPPSSCLHLSCLPTEPRQVKKFLKVDKHLSGLSKIKHEESFLKTGKDFQKIHGSTAKKLDKKADSLTHTHAL
jgi:hypothetical protein